MIHAQRHMSGTGDCEVQMKFTYSWQESYIAAVLETDWTKMHERIQEPSPPSTKGSASCPSTTGAPRKKDKPSTIPSMG